MVVFLQARISWQAPQSAQAATLNSAATSAIMAVRALTGSLVCCFLDLTEGIHNDSQQEVEENHEDQKLKGPEEEGCGNPLQALQQLQVIIHADVTQQDGKAGVHRCAKCGELLQVNNPQHCSIVHVCGTCV